MKLEPALVTQLYDLGGPDPHGYWLLVNGQFHLALPSWKEDPDHPSALTFKGPIDKDYLEFLQLTGRRHGYWVLNKANSVIVYNPTPCAHLTEDNLCDSYEKRPRICRVYSCGRHPIAP